MKNTKKQATMNDARTKAKQAKIFNPPEYKKYMINNISKHKHYATKGTGQKVVHRTFRLTVEEDVQMQMLCEKLGISRSEFMREAIMHMAKVHK